MNDLSGSWSPPVTKLAGLAELVSGTSRCPSARQRSRPKNQDGENVTSKARTDHAAVDAGTSKESALVQLKI